MKFIVLLAISITSLGIEKLSAQNSMMDRPLIIGPQYPLAFSRSRFEPDTAETLKAGEMLFSLRYLHSNSYEFSDNAAKEFDPDAASDEFLDTTDTGYSVYLDTEVFKRMASFNYGLTDSLEAQFLYREVKYDGGNLDQFIEDFHDTFGLGNRERIRTGRDQFEIYVFDNETNELVYQFTQPSQDFQTESLTIGLKYLLQETDNEMLSFKINSNFFDRYLERETNEIEGGTENVNVQDFNVSLNYSSYFSDFSIFAAYSRTYMNTPIFKRSPTQFQYIFAGINYHAADWVDLLVQGLVYTSVFPDDPNSSLGQDLTEVTLGNRFIFSDSTALELGIVENVSQGPNNIDVAFFANLVFNP